MTLRSRFTHSYTTVSETEAAALRLERPGYTVEVRPPRNESLPSTLPRFVRGIKEIQTAWLSLRNVSPVITYEIIRVNSEIRFRYIVPTKRLERKLRTQLENTVPPVTFHDSANGLPITPDTTVGGGLVTTGRRDWYPLETGFDSPPVNSLLAALHRHTMQDTDVLIQLLFQPVAGHSLRHWWWRRQAYHRIGYLRNDKEQLWNNRSPTPREKQQATAIETKIGGNRFHTSIRLAIIGAGEHTESRVKEVASAFNIYENTDTGQYLNTVTVTPLREHHLLDFLETVANREFGAWSRPFQTSTAELAALVSLPDRHQENIQYAHP